jgi:hypothetical protein
MYNGGFVAHNVLHTASQDIGLKLCNVKFLSFGFLYFLWTYGFANAAVDV